MIDYCASFEAQEGLYLGNWLASWSFGLASTSGVKDRHNEKEQTIRGELIFAGTCEQNRLRS
jgi:hypothetical protein